MQAIQCRRPSPSGRCDAQERLRRLYCCLWKTIADAPLLPAWKRWQELEYRRAKIFAHRDAHLYDAPTADAHSTGQFWRAYGQRAGCEFDLSITPLFLLRFFQNHLLIGVTHALALIPSWRAGTAHIRSDLSDLLLIDAFNHDFSLGRRFYFDTLRHPMQHRIRITHR